MTAHAPTNTVPAADSVDNVIASDVIGNKTDTVAGDSLYSQHLIGQAALAVVDGNVDTLVAALNTGAQSSYPTGASGAANFAPVAVLAGAANTLGAWVEIAAAGPAADFRIVGMSVWPDSADNHEIQVGYGAIAAEAELARHTFTVPAGQVDFQIDVRCEVGTVIPAGTRLAARSRSTTGATSTLVKIVTQIV